MNFPGKKKESRFLDRTITAALGAALGIAISRNFFITEKKIVQPIKCDFGVGDAEFSRTMSNLLGPPLVGGNRVTPLQNGDEIFPAMLEAIRGAQRSITFENFVWTEGCVTDDFTEALIERAHAGVKVHFLQDAFGCSPVHGRTMNALRRSPVNLEIFRLFGVTRLNQRTHRKLLIVDGRIGFTGGVGISDEWEGKGCGSSKWRDMQYRVEGPVVAQMQQAFLENWMETRGCILHGDDYFPHIDAVGDQECQAFKSSATEGADSARLMVLLSLAAARKHIRIANAYFVPDDLMIRTLLEARARNVEVEVIGPGPWIDQHLVRFVGRARWKPLLDAGAKFYEFDRARFHCKYLIVDDCWCSVGSTNIDDRSLRLNDEANLNVLDAEFAANHIKIFEEDKASSKPIGLKEWGRRSTKERVLSSIGGLIRSQI